MTKEEITYGSANVFADLGLPDPEQDMVKANLCHAVASILQAREMTQKQAAALLGTDQARISALLHGRITGFSTDRLLRFLSLLGHDVTIAVARQEGARGAVTVAMV